METHFSPHTVISRNDNIVAGMVDGEMMMVNIENGNYHALNATGQRIWELLETPQSVESICHLLESEYNINSETCNTQVQIFLNELTKRKAISIEEKI